MIFKSLLYRNIVVPQFFMDGQKLDECLSYKYLGHIICNDLNDNNDIIRQCRSIYGKGNSLIRTFYKCSDSVKVTLFNFYCSSLYCAQLWSRYTQATLRKICVAYHGVFKKLLDFPRSTSNSMLFTFYREPTFQELVRKCIHSFRSRLESSENPVILSLLSSSQLPSSNLNRRWRSLLY